MARKTHVAWNPDPVVQTQFEKDWERFQNGTVSYRTIVSKYGDHTIDGFKRKFVRVKNGILTIRGIKEYRRRKDTSGLN